MIQQTNTRVESGMTSRMKKGKKKPKNHPSSAQPEGRVRCQQAYLPMLLVPSLILIVEKI